VRRTRRSRPRARASRCGEGRADRAPSPRGTALALAVSTCVAVLILPARSSSALPDYLALSGYARENPILWQSAPTLSGRRDVAVNLLHLRQNLRWYASPAVTVALDTKERIFLGRDSGELVGMLTQAARRLPYFDWTATTTDEGVYAEAGIDRLWVDVTAGPVETRLGRQRIAWGTNLVWNPVDIFNPSSAIDFDNVEKPGTDAARVEYYLGPASELDLAWAPGRDSADTDAAVRLKMNRWGYDLMLLGGRRAGDEVAGVAWAGSVAGGGFRGEVLAGRPRDGSGDGSSDDGYVNASVSCDYAFPNTFYVQASVLYESRGATGDAGGVELLRAYARDDLSPGRWSLFAEVARDLNPLWRTDVSAIVNPLDGSFYAGPSLLWSAAPNLDVTAQALLFEGRAGTEFGDQGRIWMVKGQYSF